MRKIIVLLSVLLVSTAVLSCGKSKDPVKGRAGGKVLATVNGVPIFESDLPPGMRTPDAGQDALRNLVRQELIHQNALKLGLDKDEAYLRRIGEAEAQLEMFKKKELSKAFTGYLVRQAAVTDEEIREFFEKNADFINARYHVQFIFSRGSETGFEEDYKAIQGGTPFEEVASRRFPGIQTGTKAPWDLGFLPWHQIPDPWRDALKRLGPGQTSGIISGPGANRAVIRLVGKEAEPAATFETAKEKIAAYLQKRKIEELQDRMVQEMEKDSKIVYTK